MSEKYKVIDSTVPTFITITVVDWVDLLVRPVYCNILDDSLNYCIKEKGLSVHAYVYMTSHIHLILTTPLITDVEKLRKGFDFPLPKGQKFNLLNVSEDVVEYFSKKGGFFNRVNAKWVDAAVKRGEDIILATDIDDLYKTVTIEGKRIKILTGYGKEVHRFEWKHDYRFEPKSKMMLPPTKTSGLKPLTKGDDYKIVD
jgi:hypothetical protein